MTDDTYVHDPDTVRTDDRESETDDETQRQPRNMPGKTDSEFDWRGWMLVGAIVVAFLVVPSILYLLPTARDAVAALGLGFRHTYLVLPLVPAFLLGTIAVWSAVRSRQ